MSDRRPPERRPRRPPLTTAARHRPQSEDRAIALRTVQGRPSARSRRRPPRPLEPAIDAYGEAASIAPDRALPHAAIGGILVRMGRVPDALTAYDRALELSPRDETSLRGRAETLRSLGRRTDAAETLDRLAEVLDGAGRLPDACDAARRALELAESRERRRYVESLADRLRDSAGDEAAATRAGPGPPVPRAASAPPVEAPEAEPQPEPRAEPTDPTARTRTRPEPSLSPSRTRSASASPPRKPLPAAIRAPRATASSSRQRPIVQTGRRSPRSTPAIWRWQSRPTTWTCI